MAWILAVDDEEGIRNLIQNALEKDGHRASPGAKRSDGMWTARFYF